MDEDGQVMIKKGAQEAAVGIAKILYLHGEARGVIVFEFQCSADAWRKVVAAGQRFVSQLLGRRVDLEGRITPYNS